jgi:hypothetical protein
MRGITDVCSNFFRRHGLHKHDISKAIFVCSEFWIIVHLKAKAVCFRLQVHYNLGNK